MKNIEIKLADMSDLSAIEKVGDELFDHPIKIDRAKEFLEDSRHHLVLGYLDDEVIGMASAFHYVHPDKEPTLFVNEVSVLGEHQNQGLGRKLVKHLCEYGRKIGCKEAWVATESSNLPARRAYVGAGGVEEEEPVVLITLPIDVDG